MVTMDDSLASSIQRMLTQFVSVEDVCLALNVSRTELDEACRGAFAMSLEDSERMFNAAGRAALHAAQFDAAMDGDRSMLLALGKQYLGQDGTQAPQERDVTGEENVLAFVTSAHADAADRKRRAAR